MIDPSASSATAGVNDHGVSDIPEATSEGVFEAREEAPDATLGGPSEEPPVRELATVPAVEVVTRAAVMLMSAAAEKLGLAPDGAQFVDLDEARKLITALAGLLAASQDDLGLHRQPLRDALRSLQAAFRDASPYPDAPGAGPGERLLR